MNSNVAIISFQNLRRTVGLLGIFLPVVLVGLSAGVSYFQTPVQPSISDYYYTPFREIFTGTLCAVGVFLMSYRGRISANWINENTITNLAGFCVFGVALFPMHAKEDAFKIFTLLRENTGFLNGLHFGLAGVFFASLGFLSIRFFTKQDMEVYNEPALKIRRNRIYRTSGAIIFFAIAMVHVNSFLIDWYFGTIFFETVALFAFGISWLVKGKALGNFEGMKKSIYGTDAVN